MKNNLVKIIAILAFIFLNCSTNAFGQAVRFRATSISTKTSYEGKWGEWSPDQKINHLITLDINNNKITIDDGRAESVLEIVNTKQTTNKNGVSQFEFGCIQNGINYGIIWIMEGKMMPVYVLYDGTQISYTVYLYKE